MTTQTKITAEQMQDALAKALATQPLPEDRLGEVATALAQSYCPVVGIDICTVGICLDHRWEGVLKDIDLSAFLDDRLGDIRSIEIFPEGILIPDSARVRIKRGL